MHRHIGWFLVCAAVTFGTLGCSSKPAGFTLADTSWRLLSMQSMDDRQGSTDIPDPAKYTVAFRSDGQADFQIDCNTGHGTWEAQAAGDDSGNLTFGPIAVTLMACPPPSLDTKVSSSLPAVRGYRIADGRLHMSLMADGGILTWERT
jgi:heat shock protein HslJ